MMVTLHSWSDMSQKSNPCGRGHIRRDDAHGAHRSRYEENSPRPCKGCVLQPLRRGRVTRGRRTVLTGGEFPSPLREVASIFAVRRRAKPLEALPGELGREFAVSGHRAIKYPSPDARGRKHHRRQM